MSNDNSDTNKKLCKCGLHIIPETITGVKWFWARHTKETCTVELPNIRCWCGRLRTEHQNDEGHDPSAKYISSIYTLHTIDEKCLGVLDSIEMVRKATDYYKGNIPLLYSKHDLNNYRSILKFEWAFMPIDHNLVANINYPTFPPKELLGINLVGLQY